MNVMKTKKLNKTAKTNLTTYGIAFAAFAVAQLMIATGNMSSLMKGLLVRFAPMRFLRYL